MSEELDMEDDDWTDLLDYMEEGRVIPIVGPEIVTVPTDSGEEPLMRHLAVPLAEKLKVRESSLPESYTVNDVATEFLGSAKRKVDFYKKLSSLLKETEFPPSPRLLDLARIRCFKLFVTVTFDPLLAQAVNTVRYGGNDRTQVIAYSPKDVQDLPGEADSLDPPVVYHLLGKVSSAPEYAVCDDDLLEFLQSLQTEARRPQLLFDELQNHHLLILGCNFADWFTRFFIRVAKNQPLSMQRDELEWLVDRRAAHDVSLANYLEHFSDNTTIIDQTDAFIVELTRRWLERHPETELDTEAQVSAPVAEIGIGQMEPGSVFLSYASNDLAPAERIKQALEAVGVDVWFDKAELQSGDDWDHKIKRNIANCSLFMPVVSGATESRTEAYFRREWNWAVNRAEGIAQSVPFIVPVTVDDTPPYEAKVPETFHRAQWTQLPNGEVTAEFADRVKQLVRDFHRRQRAA